MSIERAFRMHSYYEIMLSIGVDLNGNQKILSSGGRGRGIFAGQDPSADSIDKIDIATNGNATDFGNLTRSKQAVSATASATRGVVFGGYASPSYYDDNIQILVNYF